LGPHLTQCGKGRGFLHAKFPLDPSNRLATMHKRYRQDKESDRQRTDSIGRTVLQTVAQNRLRLAKVIVKNTMSRFLWFTVYSEFEWRTLMDKTDGKNLAQFCKSGSIAI